MESSSRGVGVERRLLGETGHGVDPGRKSLAYHGWNEPSAAVGQAIRGSQATLWEQVFSEANLAAALGRVERNRGAAGVDGMQAGALRSWLQEHWSVTKGELDSGAYRPLPVRRVVIPKPDGGQRLLGVPSVLDRLIQQAISQVLSPIFDAGFVPVSYGFRAGKSAHQAVRAAQWAVNDGSKWVVEVDLDAFFDRVNHDMLMSRVARKVNDARLLKLIRAYLEAGIMDNGVRREVGEGTPQGSPLSPLLSNIFLDDFDQKLWKKGTRHVRYADDIRVFVRSRRAAQRAFLQATRVLEDELKLRVNRTKSKIEPATRATLLGYGFYFTKAGVRLRVAPKAWERMKARLKELTSRRWSVAMGHRIGLLNRYVRGWMAYFRLADTSRRFSDIDEWFRRRLRQIRWKEWKRACTRVRMLARLGVPAHQAYQWGNASRGYWRVAGSPILQRALPNVYWRSLGVLFLEDAWRRYRTT